MILGIPWPVCLAWALAAFFAINGVVNVVGPKGMRGALVRWGFPPWFHLLNGALQLVTGILIAVEPTRFFGLGLGTLICLAVFATLIRHHEVSHLPPGAVLFVTILVTAYGMAVV